MHSSLAIASFGSLGGIGLISCQSCHAASLPQVSHSKVIIYYSSMLLDMYLFYRSRGFKYLTCHLY